MFLHALFMQCRRQEGVAGSCFFVSTHEPVDMDRALFCDTQPPLFDKLSPADNAV